MSATKLLSDLAPNSIEFLTESRMVRLDDSSNPETEQTYLAIQGSPQGFRWLAAQLNQMANNVEENACTHSVIVSPRDLKQVKLREWSALDIVCRHLDNFSEE